MATKKNDPVKPKKDKWGRSEGSKYYSFNPDTKKYEDKEKQKALEYKRAAAASPVRAYFDKKLGVNTLTTKDPTPFLQKGGSTKKYKTGGMVNANAKVSALKSAGSHGVKSGVNPKAAASKVAKGKVGGMSTAPKTAVPKAKYGMSMRRK
jgi:hypothetical protein